MPTVSDPLYRVVLCAGLILAMPALAQSPRLIIQRAPLAGFTYHAAPALWPQLREGDALLLVREAANPYDTLAVRVDWQAPGGAQTLGYLPRTDNGAVARALDRGVLVQARISRLRDSADPRVRIEVEVSALVGGSLPAKP